MGKLPQDAQTRSESPTRRRLTLYAKFAVSGRLAMPSSPRFNAAISLFGGVRAPRPPTTVHGTHVDDPTSPNAQSLDSPWIGVQDFKLVSWNFLWCDQLTACGHAPNDGKQQSS